MKLLVIGCGAQAKYVLEICHIAGKTQVIGLLDALGDPKMGGRELYGVPILGGLEELKSFGPTADLKLILAVAEGRRKEALAMELGAQGYQFMSAIHPKAVIASTARIGIGVIINPGAVIQPLASIGDHVMIHSGTIVEHDCTVESFANLAPGVTLAGWVRVARRATLLTGCTVIPKRTIGEDAIVAAGAVVLEDVPPGATVVGVPARGLEKSS